MAKPVVPGSTMNVGSRISEPVSLDATSPLARQDVGCHELSAPRTPPSWTLPSEQRSAYALELAYDPQILPIAGELRKSAEELLQYYDHVVAAIMPWIDGVDNMWRTVMIPHALEASTLLLAILALAAEHYISKNSPSNIGDYLFWKGYYQDSSLHSLALELQNVRMGNVEAHRDDTLAAILVLCQLSMIRSDSNIWKVHWNAMRMILEDWTVRPVKLSETERFLWKEAFVYDAFASSTRFDGNISIPWQSFLDQGSIFVGYLRLVQQITAIERNTYETQSERHHQTDIPSIDHFCESFKSARLDDLNALREIAFRSERQRQDFIDLIDAYHHVGIVYTLQALAPVDIGPERRIEETQSAITCMKRMWTSKAFHHNMVWPLFIVGTEARSSPSSQAFMEAGLRQTMESTAFGNCHATLDFLRRFWTADCETNSSWISYARNEAGSGMSFVVI